MGSSNAWEQRPDCDFGSGNVFSWKIKYEFISDADQTGRRYFRAIDNGRFYSR